MVFSSARLCRKAAVAPVGTQRTFEPPLLDVAKA
jgi:hypothetical protein